MHHWLRGMTGVLLLGLSLLLLSTEALMATAKGRTCMYPSTYMACRDPHGAHGRIHKPGRFWSLGSGVGKKLRPLARYMPSLIGESAGLEHTFLARRDIALIPRSVPVYVPEEDTYDQMPTRALTNSKAARALTRLVHRLS